MTAPIAFLSRARRAASTTAERLREAWLYARHRLSGSSYVGYYADRMDRVVTRNPGWGLNLNKRFQLEYLVAHGLLPTTRFLDFGCGALAAGLHFVAYLERGGYTGTDISQEALRQGAQRLQDARLADKGARLVHLSSTSLSPLAGAQFDIGWAQSVFTHMPPADIRAVLAQLPPLLAPAGCFYATYAWSATGPEQRQFKDWYYNFDFFRDAAASARLSVEPMPDWKHPDDPRGVDLLVRFTPRC
jgi:SAM-dependent methyltransferase